MGQICFSLILVANISRMSLRILISAINKANYTVTINREQIPHVCPGEMMKTTTILLQVRCVFVTDGLQLEENQKESLLKERNIFGDIVFSPTQNDAVMYGHRFLYLIMWAKAKFNFQYLLRLDDDYFVCMDRMVNELHFRPKRSLSWGWYHCSPGGVLRLGNDGDVRRIFLGLKFSILGFFWVAKFGKYFFG